MKNNIIIAQSANQCRIRPAAQFEEPATTISFNLGGDWLRIGGRGDISVVTGKPKTRKTFLMGLMAASGMAFDSEGNPVEPGTHNVLYFDTEQSNFHASRSLDRIIAVAGRQYSEDIQYYALRGQTAEERIAIINHLVLSSENPTLVLLDGARDLVTSINDEHQATDILNLFSSWTRSKNVHLVTVLHENSGNEKVRGHLGTELTNKSENVFAVELDKQSLADTSLVRTRYCRNSVIPNFRFRVDEKGIASILKSDIAKEYSYNSPEVITVLMNVLSGSEGLGHGQFLADFKRSLEEQMIIVGDNKLKDWINKYLSEGLLKKSGKDRSPNAKYSLV